MAVTYEFKDSRWISEDGPEMVPTYYVKNPDGSYSEADPQPMRVCFGFPNGTRPFTNVMSRGNRAYDVGTGAGD